MEELGLDLAEDRRRRLVTLAEMLIEWGRSTNLTGHRTALAVVQHLVIEALALHQAVEAQAGPCEPGSRLVDLGSGAGFPGIPIAIAHPRLDVTLVDSRERRHHFQRAVRRELGVTNLDPRLGRIEELEPGFGTVVIAQAVAPARQVLGWAARWVAAGGALVLPGSVDAPDPGPHPDLLGRGRVAYRVPGSGLARCFWWYRRPGLEAGD
ncbi:MAG: 16S rRNA (guanine(527)-N(7))-methyltransferase RsmG [Myxococcota bacterium]|nr:16S rRNA (guanine(527)-N(7))-methyltransferase RsmG [Myxococcota bacterium]